MFKEMVYNLEERTSKFGESILVFVKAIKKDIYNEAIIKQMIRSATSVGANYREANRASSKRDFRNKIFICQKEVNETKHWLQMIAKTNEEVIRQARLLWKESHELTLIFSKILSSCKN